MPAKVVEIPGVGNVEFPDWMSDADISAAISKQRQPQQTQEQPAAAKTQTWAQRLGLTDPRATGMLDLAEGIASGAASTVYHGGDVIRRIAGEPRIIDRPEVQQAMRAPSSPAGVVGKFGEQVAETVIPGTQLTKALRGSSMLTRMGAEAALAGTQAAMQSGGDPLATGIGVVSGAGGGYLGARLERAAPLVGESKALDSLAAAGVPVTAGQRTGSPFIRALEKASAYTPFGALVAHQTERRTSQALSKSAQRLLEQAHKSPVVPLEAGVGVRQALTESAEKSGQLADEAYDAFRVAEADPSNLHEVQVGTEVTENGDHVPVFAEVPLPVDITGIKQQLRPIYQFMEQWWEPAKRNVSAGFQAIRSIINSPDNVPASVAEQGLSGLKELAREATGRNEGLAKFIIPQLQDTIDEAVAAAGPDVVNALKAGRTASAKEFGTKAVLKKLREEPVQAFSQMTWGNDANINLLRRVNEEAPGELIKVGRAYLGNLMEKATEEGGFTLKRAAGMFRDWQTLGPETKKLMFRNEKLVRDLDDFFLGIRKLSENPNPSGSALVGIAAGQPALLLADPVGGGAYILGMGALAKMLYSPGFARALAQAMETPAANTAASTGLFRHILRSIPAQVLKPANKEPAPAQTDRPALYRFIK